jgi:DNA polymerase-3 subunit gamma/tau
MSGQPVQSLGNAEHSALDQASSTPVVSNQTELSSESWLSVFPQLTITGIASNILANSMFKSRDGNKLCFTLDKAQSAVYSDDILPKITQAFVSFYDEELSVEIEIADVEAETPARLAQRLRDEQHAGMVKNFEEDGNVQELLQKFSGTLVNESISEASERGGNDRL